MGRFEAYPQIKMIKVQKHFTQTPDWWKENEDAPSREDCDDQIESVLNISHEIKRQFKLKESVREELRVLQEGFKAQSKLIEKLSAAVFPAEPEYDDYDRWEASPESSQYAGKTVAFVPGVGVIAHGDDLAQIAVELKNHPQGSKAGIAIVPCQTLPF